MRIAVESSWLDAMHLASASLPIGGFAYSQGLEQACDAGRITNEQEASRWIGDYLMLVLARQELPWWREVHHACQQSAWDKMSHAVTMLSALRETAELRLESRQMAHALSRLYEQWLPGFHANTLMPARLHARVFQDYSAAHAVLCALRGLSAEVGMTAWLWGWLDNQVLAAVKLVPLGQQDGQKLMHALKPLVTLAIEQAMQLEVELAGSAPIGLAVASARHETQYARLFRS